MKTPTHATVEPMHQGERLKQLLAEFERKQAHLVAETGVTPTTVWRWTKAETFTDEQWETIAKGLRGLGIDPTRIRPLPMSMRKGPAPNLATIIASFKSEQLKGILELLEHHDAAIPIVRAILADRGTRH